MTTTATEEAQTLPTPEDPRVRYVVTSKTTGTIRVRICVGNPWGRRNKDRHE